MALKNFSVDEIQSSVKTILKTSGVESYNRISKPMTDETGKEVGKAEVIYDGLAVLCAVNAELFAEVPKGAKQVICENNLFSNRRCTICHKFLLVKINNIFFVKNEIVIITVFSFSPAYMLPKCISNIIFRKRNK